MGLCHPVQGRGIAMDQWIQGGKHAYDAVICRFLSGKEPIITRLFCGQRPMKIKHHMPLFATLYPPAIHAASVIKQRYPKKTCEVHGTALAKYTYHVKRDLRGQKRTM